MAIEDYLSALSVGTQVNSQTGKSRDGLTAGGFSAFIQAITGEPPVFVPLPNKRASLVLNANQKVKLQKFLDQQVAFALRKPKDQSLVLELNPVLVPWAMKYLVPTALLFVVAGWIAHSYMSK